MPAADWIGDPIAGHDHSIEAAAEPERALALGLGAPAAPDRFVRLLFRLRGLDPDGTIEDFLSRSRFGFHVLERTPTCIVGGVATRIWPPGRGGPKPASAADWEEWASRPGAIRAVVDFQTAPAGPGRSLISTETRVDAADAAARRAFRAYWLLVGAPSKRIRRSWLRAMAERAANPASFA